MSVLREGLNKQIQEVVKGRAEKLSKLGDFNEELIKNLARIEQLNREQSKNLDKTEEVNKNLGKNLAKAEKLKEEIIGLKKSIGDLPTHDQLQEISQHLRQILEKFQDTAESLYVLIPKAVPIREIQDPQTESPMFDNKTYIDAENHIRKFEDVSETGKRDPGELKKAEQDLALLLEKHRQGISLHPLLTAKVENRMAYIQYLMGRNRKGKKHANKAKKTMEDYLKKRYSGAVPNYEAVPSGKSFHDQMKINGLWIERESGTEFLGKEK